MRRTEQLQGLRLMKFEDVYGRCYRGDLSRAEASEILGMSARTFRRWRERYEAEGAAGLYDRRLGRVSARRAPVGPAPGRRLDLAARSRTCAHNARFARPAADTGSAFVAFAGTLEDILCAQEDRVVAGDNTVRYKNRTLQIPADRHRHHYVKAQVRVHKYPDGHLAVFHGPRCLARYRADGETIDDDRLQAA